MDKPTTAALTPVPLLKTATPRLKYLLEIAHHAVIVFSGRVLGVWLCLGWTTFFFVYARPYGSPEQTYQQVNRKYCRQYFIH